jgi:hypothetical protein
MRAQSERKIAEDCRRLVVDLLAHYQGVSSNRPFHIVEE